MTIKQSSSVILMLVIKEKEKGSPKEYNRSFDLLFIKSRNSLTDQGQIYDIRSPSSVLKGHTNSRSKIPRFKTQDPEIKIQRLRQIN